MTTQVTFNPVQISNATVLISTTRGSSAVFTDYSQAVSSASLTLAYTTSTFKSVSGNVVSAVGKPVYTAALKVGQDFASTSLFTLLLNNHGVKGQIQVFPQGGTTPEFSGNVLLVAPDTAVGDADTLAEFTVKIPFDGAATYTSGA